MSGTAEEHAYEFDVAVSFAGEDRELVEDIVNQLNDHGLRVFYDADYKAAMWGEDLVEYLDQIYRAKARYTIIFVSKFYAEKMWTRHERRSALARSLAQSNTYVLPVRLDSTDLDGLRPTIGYLDARVIGVDGIVNATLAKIVGTPLAQPTAIKRVPRTEAERQQVLLLRPPAWEFLYFAGQLLLERNLIENKYRDHEILYAKTGSTLVTQANVIDYIKRLADNGARLTDKMTKLVSDTAVKERAFGAAGQQGDPDRIAHLAKRWNSIYQEFMDWAADIRGASAPSEYRHLIDLLAQYMDGPVEQYRIFVDEFVAMVDAIPGDIAAGKNIRLEITFTISIPEQVVKACDAEFERVKSLLA